MAETLTKADVDLAVKNALEEQKKVFEETFTKKTSEYESKIKELETVPKIKETFIKQGGNPKAFNSFMGTNKEVLDTSKDFSKTIEAIKKDQEYFFGGKTATDDVIVNKITNADKQVSSKKEDINEKFVGKTLTRIY